MLNRGIGSNTFCRDLALCAAHMDAGLRKRNRRSVQFSRYKRSPEFCVAEGDWKYAGYH